MNDGLLGPKLVKGHEAPVIKWGMTAGAIATGYFPDIDPSFTLG
jgi:hypothetical protein